MAENVNPVDINGGQGPDNALDILEVRLVPQAFRLGGQYVAWVIGASLLVGEKPVPVLQLSAVIFSPSAGAMETAEMSSSSASLNNPLTIIFA